jgi:hypothetical protein
MIRVGIHQRFRSALRPYLAAVQNARLSYFLSVQQAWADPTQVTEQAFTFM